MVETNEQYSKVHTLDQKINVSHGMVWEEVDDILKRTLYLVLSRQFSTNNRSRFQNVSREE